MSIAERLCIVGDAGATLTDRAVAVYYKAGIEWGNERRVGRGDIAP